MHVGQATLSLCMIVRDSQRSLDQALSSARPFMDELVVVDTGSRDDSRGIAAASGARLFDFAWCDDFSAARNYSLDQATGDWIFWMDADDVLPAESGAELRRLIAECPGRDAAFWVTVREETRRKDGQRRTTGHGHVKLFPRRPEIRFRYRIHEQVAPAINELGLPIRRTTAFIRHAADRSLAAQHARRERNLRLALLDQQQYPGDPFVLLSLGMSHLFLLGGLPKAIDFFRQSASRCPPGAPLQLNAYLYWGQALASSGQRAEEERVYREALALFANDAALLTRLASLCERTGRLPEAAGCLETALARGRIRSTAIRLLDGPERSALKLGHLYAKMGQRDRAEKFWLHYVQRHPQAESIKAALQKSYLAPCSFIVGPR